MRKTTFLVVLAAALLSLNAKCSDCDKAKATALATCQTQGADSQACKDAQAAADKVCNPVTPPTPTPPPGPTCPEQCPAGQECKDPAVGCVPVTPPPPTTCVPACAANEKCVEHGTVEHTYTCEPIPGPEEAPLIPDEDLTGVPDAGGVQMWAETDAAIKRYQKLHAEKWVEKSGGTCLVAGPAGIDDAFLGISTELLRQSIVAGQSITKGGKRSDAIFVNRPGTDLYEEMHLFDYARACVATGPNAYKGLYRRANNPGPVPTPTPPPVVTGCPYEPCPLKYFEDGKTPHWKFNSHAHTMGNADSTPVEIKNCAYCKAVGLGCLNADCSVPRCDCPVRADGNPERVPVENWLLDGGPVRDSKDGGDCTPNNTDNPYAFLMRDGMCRNCNATKTVCTAWY